MTQDEWEKEVPDAIRHDPLWTVKSYRLALFLADISWSDCVKLTKNALTRECAGQLIRATGKIPGNVSEGYSRGTGRARALFLEYALGSARESRDWYYLARRVLSERVATHRLELVAELCRLLLGTIKAERRKRPDSGDEP
ncbi:MAG: four helix bundle protein [Tepidisphaeraceae bacterium]